MKWRRALFGLGFAGLVGSAAQTGAAGSGEVEGGAYAGTTAGGWICGPAARANYGGLGARVRLTDRDRGHEDGAGWSGQVGAAAEYEHVNLSDPNCSVECNAEDFEVPGDAVMGGAYARAGYRWRWFGVEGGMGLYQGWKDNTDDKPSSRFFPNVRLSTGPEESWSVFTGVGSEGVTSARRPALIYVGGELGAGRGHRIGLQGGWARQGPALDDAFGSRVDLSWRVPLNATSFFRAAGGVSVDLDAEEAGAEGAMTLGSTF